MYALTKLWDVFMTVVILLSSSMIIMFSNDTLLKFLQSCIAEQHCFQN